MGELAAVIFDLDGVLVDSEAVWNEVRRELTIQSGGTWRLGAQRAMMGMSSHEWSRYMREELSVPMEDAEISRRVVDRVKDRYREGLPLIDGAPEAVVALAARWRLGLASSANRPIIELVLAASGLAGCFEATVSSEEVPRGKPAPDVYLEAARRLSAPSEGCCAIEDSSNGLRAAATAGMRVIAIPNRDFPPDPDATAVADVALGSIRELTPGLVSSLAGG